MGTIITKTLCGTPERIDTDLAWFLKGYSSSQITCQSVCVTPLEGEEGKAIYVFVFDISEKTKPSKTVITNYIAQGSKDQVISRTRDFFSLIAPYNPRSETLRAVLIPIAGTEDFIQTVFIEVDSTYAENLKKLQNGDFRSS